MPSKAALAPIRRCRPDTDAAALVEIYRPALAEPSAERGAVSFETVVPTAREMADRVRSSLLWIVATDDDDVPLGYAYAGRHRQRAAYRFSVEVSVYVDERAQGHGVGRRLYEVLFEALRRAGYVNAYAGIALPNPGSVALHEKMGMRHLGTYEGVGFKHGAWHDVGWWCVKLVEPPVPSSGDPPDPIAIDDVILNAALQTQ